MLFLFFFSSRRRHPRLDCDGISDVCSSDLNVAAGAARPDGAQPPRASARVPRGPVAPAASAPAATKPGGGTRGSGERRVGEEGRSRVAPDHLKKKRSPVKKGGVSIDMALPH